MNASSIEKFLKLSQEEMFKNGWPLVGKTTVYEEIPYFGSLIEYWLKTGNGVEKYTSFIRSFGWVVAFGLTKDNQVITLCQWKPGINKASWELPPGGIGKVAPGISLQEITRKTKEVYLKETGYGKGIWEYLGNTKIETGKYRGASVDDHGLPAHMFMATDLEQVQEKRDPNPNEIMSTIMVPIEEFRSVLESGFFDEASAVTCVMLAMMKLKKLQWV